jgi:hypothetical protein
LQLNGKDFLLGCLVVGSRPRYLAAVVVVQGVMLVQMLLLLLNKATLE